MCAKLLEIIGIGKVQMRAMHDNFHMLALKPDAASVAAFPLFQKSIKIF
jgi:hypothetical protein